MSHKTTASVSETDLQSLMKISIEQMLEGIQVVSKDWVYLYLNEAALRHGRVQREKIVGYKMNEVYPGIEDTSMHQLLKQVMDDRKPRSMENLFEFSEKEKCWFEIYVEPHAMGILIRSFDITARKKSEENQRHAQKMEAIGRLAGGIAHDFNNKLGIMQIFCEMALDEAKENRLRDHLQKILIAVEQSTGLTRQLLAFSRKQVMDLKILNLNDVLEESRNSLAKMLGENIKVDYFLSPELGNVRVDSSQMDQVLLNLCVNSRDAMPQGGRLTIETSNIFLDSLYCDSHSGVVPGDYVILSVKDTGVGMDQETQNRIFEPFFTTKGVGQGSGLGLSTVQGIVAQSRGHIGVESELGKGCTFKVFLPVVRESKDLQERKVESMEHLRGQERVLLVEDDPLLQQAFRNTLQNAGYQLTWASSAEEAVRCFEEMLGAFDILISDVILPGKDGGALAKILKEKKPDLKVMFVSGYTENSIVHHSILDTEAVIVQKPVSVQVLLTTLRQVLGGQMKRGLV